MMYYALVQDPNERPTIGVFSWFNDFHKNSLTIAEYP